MNKLEEQVYSIVADEVAQKKLHKATFAKAIADAMGDKDKAIALYIKHRVEQLKKEYSEELKGREDAKERKRKERIDNEKKIRELKNQRRFWICQHCNERNSPKKDYCVKCGKEWVIT